MGHLLASYFPPYSLPPTPYSLLPMSFHFTVSDGLARMPGPDHDQYDILFRHGTMTVGLYAPRGIDDQTPHTKDEIYVVMTGQATIVTPDGSAAVGPGAVIYVPAGEVHRFVEITDDLTLLVVFGPAYGSRAPNDKTTNR